KKRKGGKMAERRSLAAGIKAATSVDPALEKDFVYSNRPKAAPSAAAHAAREGKGAHAANVPRAPFTTRVRADYAAALKRASLERERAGLTPHTLQDIRDEALEPWLRNHGYLN